MAFCFSPWRKMKLWRLAIALLMIALIIGHIYIGTIGMKGAIDAMWGGQVDVNWAKEHHSIWLRRIFHRSDRAVE
jgi:formate dehydrogenase subunit gamma